MTDKNTRYSGCKYTTCSCIAFVLEEQYRIPNHVYVDFCAECGHTASAHGLFDPSEEMQCTSNPSSLTSNRMAVNDQLIILLTNSI
jgi:hypothetical protein